MRSPAWHGSRQSRTRCHRYFLAGKHESDHGNFPQAKRYYESALGFQPDNSTLLIYYAATLMRTGHASEALPTRNTRPALLPTHPMPSPCWASCNSPAIIRPMPFAPGRKSLALRPDADRQPISRSRRA
jgi:hypothetical protein